MKNVLTIIKKEFARFFKDKRMIITVLLPGLLIYLVYSVMGAFVNKIAETDDEYMFSAYIVNPPENADLNALFKLKMDMTETDSVEEAKTAVEEGTFDLLIVFPDNFDLAISGSLDQAPEVQIFYNSSEDNSYAGFIFVSGALEMFKNPSFKVNTDGNYDLAEEKETVGKILASLMPMLMFALLVSGCVAVAPEAIAGEKERGTMATMLITPIKRWQLALGKILSLTCFAMLSGISSFLGVILSLPKLMDGLVSGETAAFYSAGDYFMIFALIISVVLVIISAFSILSAFAKSVKEAGTLISPLMIVVILLGLFSIFITSPRAGLFAIPLLGSGLSMSAIMTFTIKPLAFVLSIISNLGLAAALIAVLSFMFKSEKIMFNK